jgi:hypothetical protein
MMRHDPREWRERCDCGEVHDTYNGPSFPISHCCGRECHTRICSECWRKCEDCTEYFCAHCAMAFDVTDREHTMCIKCVLGAGDEAETEKELVA